MIQLPVIPGCSAASAATHGGLLKLVQADGVLGGTIWPAASALCQYLLDNEDVVHQSYHNFRKNVLELGSGTGVVGLFYAATATASASSATTTSSIIKQQQQQIILTEHKPPISAVINSVPYNVDGTLDDELWQLKQVNDEQQQQVIKKSNKLLNLLQSNVDRNSILFDDDDDDDDTINVMVEELEWGNQNHIERMLSLTTSTKQPTNNSHINNAADADASSPMGYDLILASEVTYNTNLHDILAETTSKLLSKQQQYSNNVATSSSDVEMGSSSSSSSSLSHHQKHSQQRNQKPKCIFSHEERILNLNGNDMQLSNFYKSISKFDLDIVNEKHYPILDDDGQTTHNIQILEIQHK